MSTEETCTRLLILNDSLYVKSFSFVVFKIHLSHKSPWIVANNQWATTRNYIFHIHVRCFLNIANISPILWWPWNKTPWELKLMDFWEWQLASLKPGLWNPMKKCKMKRWLAQAAHEMVSVGFPFCLIHKHLGEKGFRQDKRQYSHYRWIQTRVLLKGLILSFATERVSQPCQKLPLRTKSFELIKGFEILVW